MDDDLDGMSAADLAAEVRKLRAGVRRHRDAAGHGLCWHHPDLWGLLPEATDPVPAVPDWPAFLRGCVRYRESLDAQLPAALRIGAGYVPPTFPQEPTMGRKQVVDVKGFEKDWGYAGVVRVGDLVFVSGLVALADDGTPVAEGDMAGQIRHVYGDLRRALQKVGCDLGDVVKEAIHTTDLAAFVAHKHVRAEFFGGGVRPASSAWHEVTKLVHPAFLVEVEAIAVAGSGAAG